MSPATVAELELLVTPRGGADAVGPWDGAVLRVRVTRPPTDGEANRAVIRLVARAVGVPPSRVSLVRGDRSRRKRLRVEGLSEDELRRRLAAIGGD